LNIIPSITGIDWKKKKTNSARDVCVKADVTKFESLRLWKIVVNY